MQPRLVWLFAFFSLLFFADRSDSAEILSYKRNGKVLCDLEGTIDRSDVAALSRAIARGCKELQLSSNGGDVEAAMEMGRAVRAAEVYVQTRTGEHCASACVLLYAAGVSRIPYGLIYIHRPYSLAPHESFGSASQKYAALRTKIRAYLVEMNSNPDLYEEMMRVPPEESRSLTLKEMEHFGISFSDPVHDEYLDSKSARRLGMTKLDFLASKARAAEQCGRIDRPLPSEESRRRAACWRRVFPGYIQN